MSISTLSNDGKGADTPPEDARETRWILKTDAIRAKRKDAKEREDAQSGARSCDLNPIYPSDRGAVLLFCA